MPDFTGTTSDVSDQYHGVMPVSYTHLRAHETRSNLVCRLLQQEYEIILWRITE